MSAPGTPAGNDEMLLDVRGLTIGFPAGEGLLLAANRIDFQVAAGQTVGLVGESGCGKSVTLRSLLGLVPYPERSAGWARISELPPSNDSRHCADGRSQ